MDPVITGAAISGVTQLIGGLFGASAQRAEAKRNRLAQLQQQAADQRMNAEGALAKNQQDAFKSLMDSYRGILG